MQAESNFKTDEIDLRVFSELYSTLHRILNDVQNLPATELIKLGFVLLALEKMPTVLEDLRFNVTVEHPEEVDNHTHSMWQFLYSPSRIVLGRADWFRSVLSSDQCETLHEVEKLAPSYAKDGLFWCEAVQGILDTKDARISIEGEFPLPL